MAKSNFTTAESAIWRAIYNEGRLGTKQFDNLLTEWASHGLHPAMMRVGPIYLAWNLDLYRSKIQEAINMGPDGTNLVQVYYHPTDCSRVVGCKSTSSWAHWSRLVLECLEGVPKGDETSPLVVENMPNLPLTVEAREALLLRGTGTGWKPRLLSLQMVAFFIAAQYEAWATQAEVNQVTPFKSAITRWLEIKVRDCPVRPVQRTDDVAALFDDMVTPKPKPPVVPIPPTSTEADLDREILATEARLNELRLAKEKARRAEIERPYLAASIVGVQVGLGGELAKITLQFGPPGRTMQRVYRTTELLEDALDGLLSS